MATPDPRRTKQLQRLLQKLGLTNTELVNWSLLDLALTHPSFSHTANYQQLEFVGDAVVRLAASEVLMKAYPDSIVGQFAAIRSIMVSDRYLAQIAQSYGVERYLLVAPSAATDKIGQQSRLADAFEAILGALYLSTHSFKLLRPWLNPILQAQAAEIRQDPALHNYKDALQEWTQAHYKILPQYHVQELKNSPLTEERFCAQVWLKDQQLGEGKGRSKKAAEQAAAKVAFYQWLNRDSGDLQEQELQKNRKITIEP